MIFILILINVSQYKTNQIYYFGHLLEKCPMIYARSIQGRPNHHNGFCPGMPDCPFFCSRFALARAFLWAICPARDRNESLAISQMFLFSLINKHQSFEKYESKVAIVSDTFVGEFSTFYLNMYVYTDVGFKISQQLFILAFWIKLQIELFEQRDYLE